MYKNLKISAIILIAGEGSRFQSFLPKQFHHLSGKKLYLHTLETFKKLNIFDSIILVCNKNYLHLVDREPAKEIKIIEGGQTRQKSSYKGLLACPKNTDIVLIHDGVRPFVTKEIILKNIETAIKFGSCNTCIKTFDTIVQTKKGLKIDKIPKRETLLRGQTPQTFNYKLILNAHKKAIKEGIENSSDDCFLALLAKNSVYIVKGDTNNIKITTNLDLFIAEQLFRLNSNKIEKSKKSLKNKKYIVVGGTGGIGKCICEFLKKNEATAISISKTSKNFKVDLRDEKSIKKVFKKIHEKHKKVDGLINAAGFLKVSPLKKLSHLEIEDMIKINLTGVILSCKEAKIKKNGHIVNIASSSYTKGRKNSSIYSSSKAAVVNFTQALAEEIPLLKINTIAPKRTNTKMRNENFPKEDKKFLLSPEKIAEIVMELLKGNLTGSIIEIK